VPPPHDYFFHYIYPETELNSALQAFITDSFAEDYKQHISDIWGLTPLQTPVPHPPPFEANPLLRLQFARWRETVFLFTSAFSGPQAPLPTSLSSLRTLCLSHLQTTAAPAPHATMRLPRDPLLPTLQRLWFDAVRVWSCHLYAYATPTPQAIDALLTCSPLVEVGAGTGYWASLIEKRAVALRESGLETECGVVVPVPLSLVIQSFDKDPTNSSANSYHGRARSWTSAICRGNATDSLVSAHRQLLLSSPDLEGREKNATPLSLFLCYPPPDSDMALRSLRQYLSMEGQTVCYVGEYRGDTGTRAFERLLESAFDCLQEVPLPNWGDTAYSLTIWKRRQQGKPELPHPSRRCSVCGCLASQMYRCRVSYAVSYCGAVCALSSRGGEIYAQELSYRCLYRHQKRSGEAAGEKEEQDEGSPALRPALRTDHAREESKPTRGRKKRRKLRQPLVDSADRAAPLREEAKESGGGQSDSESSDEDIRTQLKKYRSERDRAETPSTAPRTGQEDTVDFSAQWFMSL
jgi:hypothetical protein